MCARRPCGKRSCTTDPRGVSRVSENGASKVWRLYALLGVLLACGYFLLPASTTRELLYNVVLNVIGLATVAATLIGMRMYHPLRLLPWRLFVVGLLLLVAGDVFLTVSEFLGTKLSFPTPADAAYLAFYPFMIAGMLMIGNSWLARRRPAGVIDSLIVATGFGLLFWVYFMEPYIVEAYAGNPSLTPVSILVALAYPLMDLLLLVVLIRILVVSVNRPTSYYLLGASFGVLLVSDVTWTVAQAINSRQIANLVDLGFLLFFSLFGAAALHPSMAALFEPVPSVEARLTRLRLTLLAGASLTAPAVLALQAARGEPINAPLFVVGSATLFLLVVARMAGMMRAREQAAERERILRRAGAALAASQYKENLHQITLEATLELLRSNPAVEASLWVGSVEQMKEVATTGGTTSTRFSVDDLQEDAREHFLTGRSLGVDPADLSFTQDASRYGAKIREIFVVPLQARGKSTGAMIVAGRLPLPQEGKHALETLGAEVALALENLQLLEEVRRTSVLQERQRLSHEIHDTLAQGFTSIVMSLSAAQLAQPEASSDSAPMKRHIELARRTARESLAETRRLVWALRPEALDRHPLPQAICGLAEEWSEKTGIQVQFNVTGVPRGLLPETEVALLRIAQEALANVYKHAGADRVVLTLSYLEDLVTFDVADDGVGFDPSSSTVDVNPHAVGGFGLTSMRERIEQLNGKFSVESTPGRGTTLGAELPASRPLPGQSAQNLERETIEETR